MLRGEIGGRTLDGAGGQRPLSFDHEPKAAGDGSSGKEWLSERMSQIKAEISSLDESVQRKYADQAVALLASRGQLNAVITRRLEQGDILHGLLGATVVRVFAEAMYGEGWDQQPENSSAS